MKVHEIEEKLVQLASAVNLETEVVAAFAEMDTTVEALDAIEARLRETRAYLQHMEDVCYSARREIQIGAKSAAMAKALRS